MSIPYLNRGESIVLTTHRVSTGSALYDAMLTNQRLILMDNQYNRSEPEMIPFPDIVTVKGGKASTGEPAIVLTLKEPSPHSGSEQVSLIFTQNPGEKRRHERELWVKKLIDLVIRARELEAQNTIAPVAKKSGIQPSVRRWEAPEPIRPLSSAPEPAPPAAEPVIISEQEPDSLEFFLEEKNRHIDTGEQETRENKEITLPGRDQAAAPPTVESNVVAEYAVEREPPGQGFPPEPEIPPVEPAVPRDPFAGIHITPSPPEPGASPEPSLTKNGLIEEYRSQETFDMVVRAATESLHASRDTPAPKEPQAVPEKEPVVRKTTPIPDRSPNIPSSPPLTRQTPGDKRELPGTYTPKVSVPAMSPASEKGIPSGDHGKRPKKSAAPTHRSSAGLAIIIIIVSIAILAIAAFALNSLNNPPYSDTVITRSPSAGSFPEIGETPGSLQPAGVSVRVIYPGNFAGTIGNPGLLRQVSGRGNQTFPVLMTKSIVQATIRKLDTSPDQMTVEIYNNMSLLTSRTVNAPQGEVSLLIDATTAAAPGMSPGQTPASERPLLGNGSLIYY